ncbi:pseudouridine kinase [Aneurinibacillus soli]|uniref:Pseudouridine kinase n=1 Tax=Aneurinibacillus soli TaxID=1500254 RepID=A0A0U5BEM8_9BACL|nr:PfkB family carbohydrate kinase [Aneurinibacillus soli]PYE62101.1 pseudouridine kinase [Aneurinibacillus soli]BAU28711.1 Pseudouridine kinase [Aneurinibacillus soli]
MQPFVSVIGTTFIDCKGFAAQAYQPDGRNLGSIQFVHGGVGRNVAENLANLEVPTGFVSSVDRTGLGDEVLARLARVNVETKYVQACEKEGMGMWLAILNENGDLAGSISQMPNLGALEAAVKRHGDALVSESTHIVLEIDLTEAIARETLTVARCHNIPVYGIPGNLDIVQKHPDLLDGMEGFICNNFEADQLLGIDFTHLGRADQQAALAAFAEKHGLRQFVVTLGENGSVFYDSRTKEAGYQSVFPVKMVDSSGAGDAFFSGTVMGLVRGLTLAEAVVCGTKVAAWTIESPENNCQTLSVKMQADEVFQQLFVK